MKKGITLVMLAAAVVILAILAGVMISFSDSMLQSVKKSEFAMEMLNVQTYADNYYQEYGNYPTSGTVAFSIEGFNDFKAKQFEGETINNNIVTLYKLNVSSLGIDETIFGNNTSEYDVYAVSTTTNKVYYLYGVEYNDEVHYTLNDKLYGNVNGKEDVNKIKIKDVIFNVSSIEKTKDAVTINVQIPTSATLDSITATNSVVIGTTVVENGYQKIPVNTTNIAGNYVLTVVYTLNDKQNTATYEVKNSDNIGPVIQVTTTKQNGYTVLNVNVTDSTSGVDIIKYETTQIDSVEYFKYSGKKVNGNVINCHMSGTYTIYAVDKLGNGTLITQNISVD